MDQPTGAERGSADPATRAPESAPSAPAADRPEQADPPAGRASSLLRSGAMMALGTLASRITGFLRSVVLVAALGTAALGDAYNTANTIPFIVYDLLLGGILTSVVVPLLVRARERDPVYGGQYEQRLFTMALTGLAVMAGIAALLAPLIIEIYANEYQGAQRDLAVLFTRLFAVQIFFLGVSAFAGAILNTRRSFIAPMWAPVLNNIVICATGVTFLLVVTGAVTPESIAGPEVALLATGTIGGIALQTLALWPALRRSGFRWRPRFDFRRAELGEIGGMAIWTLAYVLITQAGFAVTTKLLNNTGVQGRLEDVGNVGYTPYFNAYQLFQLPYAIIGVTVITALLPRMSEHAAEGKRSLVRDDFSSGLRIATVVILPAAALMFVLAPEIATALFAHGQTTRADALVIGDVMRMFAVALVPFSAYQLMLRVFYAHGDTRTPALVAIVTVSTNVAMAVTLYNVLPTQRIAMGIAGGFAVANLVGTVVCWAILRRKLNGIDGRRIALAHLKLAVAIWPLIGFAYAAHAVVDATMDPGFAASAVALVIGSAGGGLLYLVFARLLRVSEVQTLLSTVTSRLPGRG